MEICGRDINETVSNCVEKKELCLSISDFRVEDLSEEVRLGSQKTCCECRVKFRSYSIVALEL